jgi:translation initiation factor IF-2
LGDEVVLLDMDLQDNFKIFDEPKPVNTANHSEVQNLQLLEILQQDLKEEKERKGLLELKRKRILLLL